jgi:hypothetical protein
MTGKPLDPEEVIRAWLADSVPNRAPSSLKETLEDATSEPAGNAQPWSRSRVGRFRLAGRMAAAVAIIAIAASGAYLFESGRATPPGQGTGSPSGLPTAMTSATGAPGASPSTSITALQPKVTRLPGSTWNRVTGVMPAPTMALYGWTGPQFFALPSGGFVALSPADSGNMRVLSSADGITWNEGLQLPAGGAIVTDVTESGGTLVAGGYVPGTGPALGAAMAWTMAAGQAWIATPLSTANWSIASHVAVGPAGFLVSGYAPNQLWASADGIGWHAIVATGISSDVHADALLGNGTGYILAQLMPPEVWHSTDGVRWTKTYQAPALSGISTYYMGSIMKAPDGSYRAFGGIYTGTGIAIPNAPLGDTTIWTSPDLIHWTMSGPIKTPGWGAFVPIAGGFAVAGIQTYSADPNALEPLGVWTSGDGRTWKPLAGVSSLPHCQVVAVVGDGSHTVIAFVNPQQQIELLVGDALK